jgi:putative peptide zinc metalloprotease protein
MNVPTSIDLNYIDGVDNELQVDTLESKRSYLVVSRSGAHVKMSSSAYQLFQAVKAGYTLTEIAQQINSNGPTQVTPTELGKLYENINTQLTQIEVEAEKRRFPWGFWMNLRLVPGSLVSRISSFLSPVYSFPFVIVLLAAIAIGLISFFQRVKITTSDSALLWGYSLYLLSLIVHEFGHSTACARYGSTPRDIGFTLYLIYPALYSDVSSAWKLTRWQRVIVDLGGNYFQCAVAGVFALGFQISHWEAFRIASVIIIYSCLFSLNPFFKFDGYWVLADMLGVTNLSTQPRRIARHFIARFVRRETAALPWSAGVVSALVVYSAVTGLAWALFLYRLIPSLMVRLHLFVEGTSGMTGQIASGKLPQAHEIRTFAVSLFLLLIWMVMVWNLIRTIGGQMRRWLRYGLQKIGWKESAPAIKEVLAR